jgi:hypothetical protein
MKFARIETSLLPGHRVVKYVCQDTSDKFEIHVSSRGIYIAGESTLISTQDELNSFAEIIAKAWQHHELLKNAN